ncbi:hypothetical protein KBP30_14505 [Streptomyces sp. Go40/10]|uniref:hypothetical protein n=1 Tax=Streptomyces sp. Go40/10 TaxID=2825844 RepID=UPI001E57E45D|nr:hypothetical protein [Streptomyces sp. Go40/10]UFR02320.1 hypothetical protein KBP30_14505 [Streptomyces sp. Go40/10]
MRTLASRWAGPSRPSRSGPLYLLASDAGESARLAATADALSGGEPDQATVVVSASIAGSTVLWQHLAPVLDECGRTGITGVRLLWAGAGADLPDRPAPARRVADTWGLDVVAPAGPVVVAPGGTLFTPAEPGGWRHFAPGLAPRPLGLRHPVPSWEDAAARLTADAVDGHVVEPVPAGVLIRTAGPVPDAERAVAASIPVDEHRLAVVVGTPGTPPVSARALAELLALLPSRARAAARLVPGDGRDLLGGGQETADLLGTEVEVVSGVPVLLERADGADEDWAVVLIGADGEPTWRPYVEAVACRPAPGGPAPAPRVLRWRPPVAGLAAGPRDGVLLLDDVWQVAVTRAGLWVGPHGDVPAEASGRALAADTVTVDVGAPGQRLDDRLWPVLDTLVEGLEPSVRARTTLHVLGRCGPQGRRLLRRLAERGDLALEYRQDDGAEETAAEPAAPHADADTAQAPWHASPMSVRVRRVSAPPAPVVDTPAVPAAAAVRAPVPPGYAQALAASRSVGGPGGRSVPVPWKVAREAPTGLSTAPTAPAPTATSTSTSTQRTAPTPVPQGPPAPRTQPPAPAPAPAPAPPHRAPQGLAPARPATEGPAPARPTTQAPAPVRPPTPEHSPAPATPGRRAALPVRITPLHRSSPADRQAVQALAGEQWWQQQAAVARTLMVVPGLRMHQQSEETPADLVAVRCFLTLDDGPLSWTWLERRLALGADEALPYLSCLASGLRRLPSYRGVVVRDAGTLPPGASALPPGTELCEPGPVGALALDGAPASAADRYLVWSVTGRRVRGLFTPGPAGGPAGHGEEVVFGPGTRFRVLGTQGRPGAMTVLLREVTDGGPAARSGEQEAGDRAALGALRQAADREPAAGPAASWPPRLAGQLAERPPEADDRA